MIRPWKLPEVRILEAALATGDRIGQIARRLAPQLGRTESAIRAQAATLRAQRGDAPQITRRRWSGEDLARLRQAAAEGRSLTWMARALRRSIPAIKTKLWIERGER
jgi:hypothetical protein